MKIRQYTKQSLAGYPSSIPPWSLGKISISKLVEVYPKRKSTDYNGMELLVAIQLAFKPKTVKSLMNLLDNPNRLANMIIFNSPEELVEYTKDLKSKPKLLEDYLQNFRKETFSQKWVISKVFLTGKTNTIEEIEDLNREVPDAKRNAKADV